MLKATIKGLFAHKLRLGLTALAVVLGVGFISGTYVLTDTMNATFDDLFQEVTAGVDVYVGSKTAFTGDQGEDRKPIPESLLDKVRRVPGVAVAEGTVTGYAQLVDKDGKAIAPVGPPTLGASWSDHRLSALTIRSGHPPRTRNEVVIDAATADRYGFEVGDRIEVLLVGGPRRFTLAGIAGFGEADNLAGATLAVFDLETAQRVLDKQGQFDAIEVIAEEGVSAVALRSRLDDVLPDHLEATTAGTVAEDQADAIQRGLRFFNTALLVFAGIALFVGCFIIFNTFSIIVAQRTREFALLRALGASRAQVLSSVLIEALVVGIVASGAGLAVGVAIAIGLRALLTAFGIDLPSTDLQLLPRTVVVSFVAGTLVTIVASVIPARKSARVSPVEALRESIAETYRPSRRRLLTGTALVVGGVAVLFGGLFAELDQPAAVVGAGALIIFLGIATLGPVFAGRLARFVGAPVATAFSVPGKLGVENAARNPKRTTATAAALMIGLALVSLTTIFGASLKASANDLIDESLKADLIVVTEAFGPTSGFSPEVGRRIARQENVTASAAARFGQWRHKGDLSFLTALEPGEFERVVSLGTVRGGEIGDLQNGGVFVAEETASDLGLEVGDELTMEFAATGKKEMDVLGTFANNDLVGSSYLISLATYKENFARQLDDIVFVKLAAGARPEARRVVEKVAAAFPNVSVQDQTEFKERQSEQVDQLLGLVSALLALALLIAFLGITNTLALSVFERTREIGLLRAVGMGRRQARAMIRWESVVIAIIGALLGLVVGSFFGWALVQALEDEGVRRLAVPLGQLLGYVIVAGLAGVLAGLPPARRAARLNVLEAIATE